MKQLSILLAFSMVLVVGCPGQVPKPTSPQVPMTCTAPPSCSTGGCTFVFARATCTGTTAASCPANTAGNSAFVALNATAPSSTCAYTDAAPPSGANVIYTASTIQNGLTSLPSANSNQGVPSVIPLVPAAPGAPSGTVTSAELAPPIVVAPALPEVKPTVVAGSTIVAAPMQVVARVVYPAAR